MSRTWAAVPTKSLTDLRRPVVAWAAGMSSIVVLEAALWPTVRDMPHLDDLLAGYPEALTEAFGFDAMSTGPGFLDAELLTLVLPALFIAFALPWGRAASPGRKSPGRSDRCWPPQSLGLPSTRPRRWRCSSDS